MKHEMILYINGRVISVFGYDTYTHLITRFDCDGGVTRVDAIVEPSDLGAVWYSQRSLENGEDAGYIKTGYAETVNKAITDAAENLSHARAVSKGGN